MTPPQQRRARLRTQAALGTIGVLLCIGTVSASYAAYQDSVNIVIGSEAVVGNPHTFQLQLQNGEGAWVTAGSAADSVLVATVPDATVSTARLTEFSVPFRLQANSPVGSVTPQILAPSSCTERCAALFGRLRFTIFNDGVLVASGTSADDFNSLAGREFLAIQPDEPHLLTLQATLDRDTPFMWSGSTTEITVALVGSTS